MAWQAGIQIALLARKALVTLAGGQGQHLEFALHLLDLERLRKPPQQFHQRGVLFGQCVHLGPGQGQDPARGQDLDRRRGRPGTQQIGQ